MKKFNVMFKTKYNGKWITTGFNMSRDDAKQYLNNHQQTFPTNRYWTDAKIVFCNF